ncbi:HNH endonuclease signature motif containing protein [Cellulomonas sp.]|uniref:HNH endonuclease signature motif containing protein n=1 Tax=Cellulomonas sp. TaxID=40001 RepID=UPI003BA8C363
MFEYQRSQVANTVALAGVPSAPRIAEPPTAGVAGAGAAVDDVLAASRLLASHLDPAWSGDAAQRRAILRTLDLVAGVLAGVRARVVRAEQDSAAWQRPGVVSFEDARSRQTRSGLPGARREVRQADALTTMRAVASAVESGAMPIAHLDALARIAATSGDVVAGAFATPAVQEAVVRAAAHQDAPAFGRTLQRMVAELDPGSRERAHENQRARRFLHLSDQADGTHVKGLLDSVAGHRLRLALEAVGERPGAVVDASSGAVLEERTSEQARADALDALARRVLSLPETASGASVPPQISLLMSEETFAALRTRRRASGGSRAFTESSEACPGAGLVGEGLSATGESPHAREAARLVSEGLSASAGAAPRAPTPSARLDELAGVPPVTLEDGTPLPMSEVAQALCDCELTRVVMDADGLPTNLGRSVRLYSGAHRRAVVARDRHCGFTGCRRPARWCQIHHIDWWERDGGETSLENGVLLCSFHHHQVHLHDLRIERDRPPGTSRARPRSRGRPPDPTEPGATYTFTDPAGRVVAARSSDGLAGDDELAGRH